MATTPNKLSQFWQELKRRNVVRVSTVYAGAAFVIIELINNITEPLHLPEWTPTFVIVLLAIGFPILIIFSWIYDVHPEGGIVKTEPAEKVKAEKIPKSSNSWKIASYVSFAVILGLIVLNVIPRAGKKEILDKSIAVLPFESLSDDPEKRYQADGVMDAILLHLSKIEDLRVVSRTSVEQYRGTDKTINEICEEQDVAYVLEGSYRRYGDEARLIVQLIRAGKEGHVWANQYDRNWGNILQVESEVAQEVARELQAVITPEEKQRIENIPTSNLTAYDFYQRGRQELGWDLDLAKKHFLEAHNYDSTFAEAYTGLAMVYYHQLYMTDYLSENYLDSMLILTNIALSYNDQLDEAYLIRGIYYWQIGNMDLAEMDFNQAVMLNPNNGKAYSRLSQMNLFTDFVKSISNQHKSISVDRGPDLGSRIFNLGYRYLMAGFLDKAEYYYREGFKLTNDTASFNGLMGMIQHFKGNFEEAIEYFKKCRLHHKYYNTWLGIDLYMIGEKKESLEVFEEWIESQQEQGDLSINSMQRVAYAYWINGDQEKADYYFDLQIEYSLGIIELNRLYAQTYFSYYDLAGVYAFRGEKEKAYENLRIMNQAEVFAWFLANLIKWDEMFDSIREEPEFQQIVRDVEAKYQAEHERVRQWLEDNEML